MNLSQEDWAKSINKFDNSVVIDVRTTEEFEEGFINNSIHLNIYDSQLFLEGINKLDKNHNIHIIGYYDELINYNMGLHPIDGYTDIYRNISVFEADRFLKAKESDAVDNFVPVVNEVLLNAELFIPQDFNPKCVLQRDYTVHLQGIIDRMFLDEGGYVPIELKTGPWKEYKRTSMRQELAFYKLLVDNAPDEELEKAKKDK